MNIISGYFHNSKIEIGLIDGTSGQIQIKIEFSNDSGKFSDIDSNKIKEICKFPTDKDIEAPSGFIWSYDYDESNKFVLIYRYGFEILERIGVTQQFHLLDSVFTIVKDLNHADLRIEKECPPDNVKTEKSDE